MLGVLRVALIAHTFLVVLLIVPITSNPTSDSKTALLHVTAALLGVLMFGGWLLGRLPVPRLRLFIGPLVLLLLTYAIAAAFSDYPLHSVPHLTRLASLFMLYLAASLSMRSVAQVRYWILAACGAVALSSAYALSQWLGFEPLPWDKAERTSEIFQEMPGTFGNPNYAGHAMVLCTVLAAYLICLPRWRWAVLFPILYAVQMSFAFQRGALVALTAAAAFLIVALGIRRLVRVPAQAIAAAFGVVLLGSAATVAVILMAGVQHSTLFLDRSALLRINAYAGAANMIVDRPVLGFGPGNYVIANAPYWTEYEQRWFATKKLMNEHVHCDPLEVAIDAGLPAAAAFLALLLLGAIHGLRLAFQAAAPEDRNMRIFGHAAAAFFIAFLVDGLFGFDFYVRASATFLFIFAGCMEGLTAGSPAAVTTARYQKPVAITGLAAALALGFLGLTDYVGSYWLHHGRRAMVSRQYSLADELLARGEPFQRWNWLFPYHRGAAAQLAGNNSLARDHFVETLRRNPNYVPAITYLARLHLAQARELLPDSKAPAEQALEQSATLAGRSLGLVPVRPEDMDVLGRVFFLRAAAGIPDLAGGQQELWRQSRAHLERSLELGAPKDRQSLLMIAQSAAVLGDTEAAEAAFANAIAPLPNDPDSYASYFRFAQQHQRWERYVMMLGSQLAVTVPDVTGSQPQAWQWLSKAMETGIHHPEGLDQLLLMALHKAPEVPYLWALYARHAQTPAERHQYAALVQQLVQSETASLPVTARILGLAWSGERGALPGATKLLNDAITSDAGRLRDPQASADLAIAADLLESTLRAAPPTAPGIAVAAINLAAMRLRLGQPTQAVDLLAEKFEQMRQAERVLAAPTFAEALMAAGQGTEAEAMVRSLIALDPNQAELTLLLARVLARNGKVGDAKDLYDVLLAVPDLDPAMKRLLLNERAALRTH